MLSCNVHQAVSSTAANTTIFYNITHARSIPYANPNTKRDDGGVLHTKLLADYIMIFGSYS